MKMTTATGSSPFFSRPAIRRPSPRLLAVSSPSVAGNKTSQEGRGGGQRGEEAKVNKSQRGIFKGEAVAASSRRRWKEYLEETRDFVALEAGGGPPRWFSPVECGAQLGLDNPPLLLFLPGIEGVGLGLARHHDTLGKFFQVWCLHIPVQDKTSFSGLVQLVERTIISENHSRPTRPIYLVGESLGACLALAVAARNPDIDLVLILANPATSFEKSQLQALVPFLEVFQDPFQLSAPYILSLMTGDDPLRLTFDNMMKGLPLRLVQLLSQDNPVSSYLSVRFNSK